MDAVKFLKEDRRMCEKRKCSNCPVFHYLGKMGKWCNDFKKNHPEQYVEIVEKWSAEHPVKTRQSVLLESYPNAKKGSNGILMASPCYFDENVKNRCKQYDTCADCQKEYWLAEVE